MKKQIMMFGAYVHLDRLSKLGDPREKLNAAIKERVRKKDYSKGGRPPVDEILMFKITLLQDWNNISARQTYEAFAVSPKTGFRLYYPPHGWNSYQNNRQGTSRKRNLRHEFGVQLQTYRLFGERKKTPAISQGVSLPF